MNVKLIRPDNGQKADIVAVAREHVCLRLGDTVTPAVRWWPLVQIQSVNNRIDVIDILLCHDINEAYCELLDTGNAEHWYSRAVYETKLYRDIAAAINPPQPLTVVVTPDMAAAISHTSGVEIVVRKTVTVSMWHESMVA